jgi:radical SAM protein with 4Fe4S-binding SPASM domain
MTFPCKSPWTFAKIMPNGDVQLCYQFTIGNLRDASFEQIWFGEAAEAVRARVVRTRPICEACDYYRFCLNSTAIETENPENYFSREFIPGLSSLDFTTGVMNHVRREPPILVETIGSSNIVRYQGRYVCVPHALGPLDLRQVDLAALPGVLITQTLREARAAVRDAE